MAELLRQFVEPVFSADRKSYRAQAVGRAMPDGMWEGWVELFPIAGGASVRSSRETTQSNRDEAFYWASSLSTTYLEGSLARALGQPVVPITPPAVVDDTAFAESSRQRPVVDAILDPFSVYEKGETLLRKQLGALAAWHLVNIIVAYQLSEEPESVLNHLRQGALIDLIVAGVREHAFTR
jgi:hypothetical protein